MPVSPNQSPAGSTTHPTLVDNGNNNNEDLEHGSIAWGQNEKDKKTNGDSSKQADTDVIDAAATGEIPVEGLGISKEEREKLDADPNIIDWDGPNDPQYVLLLDILIILFPQFLCAIKGHFNLIWLLEIL